MIATSAALGLVVWLITTIIVESEICAPIREWVERWSDGAWVETDDTGDYTYRSHPIREKIAYLIHCHLCAGTWVGLLTAAVTPYRPLASTLPLGAGLLAGLLYKAIAHLILAINNTFRRYS